MHQKPRSEQVVADVIPKEEEKNSKKNICSKISLFQVVLLLHLYIKIYGWGFLPYSSE